MPKGVYERTERHRAISAENAAKATAASAEYWRGRKRSEEQKAAHSARMRGRSPSNKGVPMPAEQKATQTDHGHAAGGVSPTYVSWRSMMQRCTDPSKDNYKYYGGRGVAVCERWRVFANFLADMGERPAGMQLSRVDNDGHYEPGNVTWATRAENIAERNRRVAAKT
jgi:hypothetical protein